MEITQLGMEAFFSSKFVGDLTARGAEWSAIVGEFGADCATLGALVVDVVHWIRWRCFVWSGRDVLAPETEKARECGPWMKWMGKGDAECSGLIRPLALDHRD